MRTLACLLLLALAVVVVPGAQAAYGSSRKPPRCDNSSRRPKLKATADDLGPPGVDPVYGYGRVNAYGAVTELGRIPPRRDDRRARGRLERV
jgi:hypothetical protein